MTMGKIETFAVLGVMGVLGYFVWSKWSDIKGIFNAPAEAAQAAQTFVYNQGADAGSAALAAWQAANLPGIIAAGNAAVQADIQAAFNRADVRDLEARRLNLEYQLAKGYGNASEEQLMIKQLNESILTLNTRGTTAANIVKSSISKDAFGQYHINPTPGWNIPSQGGYSGPGSTSSGSSAALSGLSSSGTSNASAFNPGLGEYAWAQPGSAKWAEGVSKGVIK